MEAEGNILKMLTKYASPVQYFLPVGDGVVEMNSLIGGKISLQFTGLINCVSCGKKIKRSFNQGFCHNCLQTAPEASETIIRPELSKAHLGVARDLEWARTYDLTEHVVYLALTGQVKVGVAVQQNIPTRWIDQGAVRAIRLALTPNRHIAGVIEVFLKKYYADRASYKSMLCNTSFGTTDFLAEKQKVQSLLPRALQKYIHPDDAVTDIMYPLQVVPEKIGSTGFDKQPLIEGVLAGIKGQYLVFEDGCVLNIRKYSGYCIRVSW